jgi:hypothetical protein
MAAFRDTPLHNEPFPYFIVPDFVQSHHLAEIHQDYPQVPGAGSYPIDLLSYGPHFEQLVRELGGEAFRQAVAEKFAIDLTGLPVLMTVRGHCQLKDGRIHTDTQSKIITLLLYFNPDWEDTGGRLRLLRDPKDMDSVITEIPPQQGTLLMFKVSDNSWHGHKPFQGPRRVVQLNYVTEQSVVDKELARHRLSAKFKRLKNFFSKPKG